MLGVFMVLMLTGMKKDLVNQFLELEIFIRSIKRSLREEDTAIESQSQTILI